MQQWARISLLVTKTPSKRIAVQIKYPIKNQKKKNQIIKKKNNKIIIIVITIKTSLITTKTKKMIKANKKKVKIKNQKVQNQLLTKNLKCSKFCLKMLQIYQFQNQEYINVMNNFLFFVLNY